MIERGRKRQRGERAERERGVREEKEGVRVVLLLMSFQTSA